MDTLLQFVDVFLHLDAHLSEWASVLGPWLYVVLFLIVFCETGLVVTPFLPGDSLLFAAGALCALDGSPLSIVPLAALLIVAAVSGDALNYSIGALPRPGGLQQRALALPEPRAPDPHPAVLRAPRRQDHLPGALRARSCAPSRRSSPASGACATPHFASYNVTGAFAWVLSFLLAGYWFGQIPTVKRNFHIVIVAIIVISVLPMVFEFLRARRASAAA